MFSRNHFVVSTKHVNPLYILKLEQIASVPILKFVATNFRIGTLGFTHFLIEFN